VRAVLKRGDDFIAEIRSQNAAIPGAEVTRKIDQIEIVLQSIFARAKEHPEVVDELDRLMNYYLPTTVKLLDAYRDLDAQPIQGANILKSKSDIEDTLDALNVAFEKLLDSIFNDMAWDISTDVSVLQTVLAQEGLTEDPFKDKK
jgi:5-bromo-4-chloroindolyl phosphate hydrolysis protein